MTGKKMIDTILTALMLLSTLGVMGLFYYTEKVYKRPPINEEAEKAKLLTEVDAKALPTFFKVDKMTISLIPRSQSNVSRMRWLELEAHLVLFSAEELEKIKIKLPIVQDRIIEISSKMGAEELNTVSGKILLEDRLKREINKALGEAVVKNIFFASFIVQ